MLRRDFLKHTGIGFALCLAPIPLRWAAADEIGKTVKADEIGKPVNKADEIGKITRTEKEWKQMLTKEQFDVLREEGTEHPFTSPLLAEHRAGKFVCAGCGLELFTSDKKFESGTGWPSFFDKIEGHVETKSDHKLPMERTEYHCARCGGHQGHVFNDGPQPTGLRYCNNGVSLKFVPMEG